VKPHFDATPTRLGALALISLLGGCSSINDALSGDKVDYSSAPVKQKSLEVPPDLTQLARQSRYQTAGGVVSAGAAAAATPAAATPASTTPAVALQAQGDVVVERDGQQRWLVTKQSPEQLWPQLRAFWEKRGFTIAVEDAKAGVMETNWGENRAKLPSDAVRNTIGSMLRNLYDTGERDRFRTRIERTPTGSEIYVSHRGAQEVFTDERREGTTWKGRANDPQLEAEFLSQIMVMLGSKPEPARTALAAATPAAAATAATAPPAAARARAIEGSAALEVDETFDRAWRRVGLALDRAGFTVEDRDRALGIYYVRYVDPKGVGKEEPGWWARLLGDTSNPQAAVRYRVALKGSGARTVVAVLTSAGSPDVGENGKRISSALVDELR
jgi:outer membrane protein assembly factor BamC